MSLNVGNISARFGLDPAEFLEKMRGVSGATELFSNQMKRSMKESAREGAESLHLLDHALGIQLPRSMNRLITQEFPALAAGLQSILGVGAVGVLAEAGFEFGEKIAKQIEKAKKAQQDYDDAIRHTQEVIGDLGASHARTMKEIELRMAEQAHRPGAKTAALDFKIDTSALELAKKQIGEITDAIEKEAKSAQLAKKWTTEFWLAVAAVNPFSGESEFWSRSGKEADQAQDKFKNFKRTLDEIMQGHAVDPLQGLRDSLKKTSDELSTTGTDIARKMAAIQLAQATTVLLPGPHGSQVATHPGAGVNAEALATEQKYFELLKQEQKMLSDIRTEDQGHRKVAAGDDSAARRLKAAQDLAALYRDMAAGSNKLQPETDPIKKLANEIGGLKLAAEKDFFTIAGSAASALDMRKAAQHLADYERLLDQVMLKARRDAAVTAAATKLPTTIAPTGPAPVFAAPTAMPTLGAGGLAGAKLDTFSKDDDAQLNMAAQAYDAAMTAQDKYKLGKQELELLVAKGLIDQNAQTAAMAQLDQQLVKAASSAHKLQEEMQKMLERSDDAAAGVKAYGLQLQINAAENGKFTYDVLTASTKGAEDEATKSLFAILEEQRGGHLKLIHDLEAMWSSYFKNLATMGMKQGMDKLLAPLGKAISGGMKPQTDPLTRAPAKGAAGIFGSIFGQTKPGASATGAATLTSAGTILHTAAAALLSAATALRASAAGGLGGGASASGSAGPFGGVANDIAGTIPFFAAGGDATPGSSFVSGEAGAEEVDLDRSGGAHITPLGVSQASNGETHHHYDMRGSIVTDDVMRRTEAAAAIKASEGRMLSSMPAMQREINLRRRT
jgi:hypothetical protein